jgi:hypothetical protein
MFSNWLSRGGVVHFFVILKCQHLFQGLVYQHKLGKAPVAGHPVSQAPRSSADLSCCFSTAQGTDGFSRATECFHFTWDLRLSLPPLWVVDKHFRCLTPTNLFSLFTWRYTATRLDPPVVWRAGGTGSCPVNITIGSWEQPYNQKRSLKLPPTPNHPESIAFFSEHHPLPVPNQRPLPQKGSANTSGILIGGNLCVTTMEPTLQLILRIGNPWRSPMSETASSGLITALALLSFRLHWCLR